MECSRAVFSFGLYSIFSLYLIKGTIFEKNVIEREMGVLMFSKTFV
jgi:hypothetical protein